jgi:uncharacterized integral membrane protein (TIGR00698 family)
MTAPAPPPSGVARFVPGLVLCAALAAAALGLASVPWVADTLHVSALLLVIVFGIAWRAFLPLPDAAMPGVRLAGRGVLRWAVAGLGFRLSLAGLVAIGPAPLVVVTVSTFAALFVGVWIARRLRVPEGLGLLLGVGGAVCGASAVVAADTVVRGERRDAPVAIGIVTILGTIGMLLDPVVGRALGLTDLVYGVWAGASLQETAHVVAAGHAVGPAALETATVVKLARIALLAPIVLGLGWALRGRRAGKADVAPVPWFLVVFVLFAALHSTGVLPPAVVAWLVRVDLWLLCLGMAGVGLQTAVADLRAAGVRPLAAATAQWVFLSGVSLALAVWLCR